MSRPSHRDPAGWNQGQPPPAVTAVIVMDLNIDGIVVYVGERERSGTLWDSTSSTSSLAWQPDWYWMPIPGREVVASPERRLAELESLARGVLDKGGLNNQTATLLADLSRWTGGRGALPDSRESGILRDFARRARAIVKGEVAS